MTKHILCSQGGCTDSKDVMKLQHQHMLVNEWPRLDAWKIQRQGLCTAEDFPVVEEVCLTLFSSVQIVSRSLMSNVMAQGTGR